jgi:hypothetical protein
VLNLLPLPILDGGHLMYYLWEGTTGRTVSNWMEGLQRGSVAVLLCMMSSLCLTMSPGSLAGLQSAFEPIFKRAKNTKIHAKKNRNPDSTVSNFRLSMPFA